MKNSPRPTGRFLSVFPLATVIALFSSGAIGADAPPSPAAIRIVQCGTQVQSTKRGVCENKMFPEDFKAFAPGVSWYYNWHFTTDDFPPDGVHMDFIPQVWGKDSEAAGADTYLSTHKARMILAINEPNLKGQSFISPQATAELYKKIKAVADKYNLQVAGPNMSLGSSDSDSIKAMDPIDKKEVTYTFMIPFLKAFYYYMGATPVPYTAYHTYGNMGELKWATAEIYKQFKKPVWVTEYAYWNASSPQEALKYLVQATDYFERSPFVAGYAWFKERASNNASNISLLGLNPGELTPLGKAYVNLPVHDANLYYRLPGRLSAGSYVNMANSEIEPTNDTSGNFDMYSTGPALLDYNLQVDEAGNYTLKFRLSDSGKPIEISENGKTLGWTSRTARGWQTIEATLPLPAGPQTLHLRTGGQTLNWIEFSKAAPGTPLAPVTEPTPTPAPVAPAPAATPPAAPAGK